MADFPDLDLDAFWEDSEIAESTYGDGHPSDDLVASVEAELGFRLPRSYVALMRTRNGGFPRNTCCPAPSRTTWAEDHVAITAIMGIGREKDCSLAGPSGSQFFVEEWGYPAIGVYFADRRGRPVVRRPRNKIRQSRAAAPGPCSTPPSGRGPCSGRRPGVRPA